MKLLPAIGITVAGIFILSKALTASAAPRLNFLIGDVKLAYSGLQPVLTLTLQVQNPTNTGFTVNAVVANVTLNGEYIGNVSGFTPVYIAPTSGPTPTTNVIPLQVLISTGGLVSDITDILTGAVSLHAQFEISGTVNLDGLLVPLNVQYNPL